jgi:hydroxyacylglutathione hydrolase
MHLPLEDLFNDVIAKAQRGLRISDNDLATRAGLSVEVVQAAKAGSESAPAVLSALASALALHGPTLIAMARNEWQPQAVQIDGLAQFNSVFDDMTVNAYLVWDPASRLACAFDTGANAEPLLLAIRERGLTLHTLFITHTHSDHIAELAKIASAHRCAIRIHEREPHPGAESFAITPGTAWSIGALRIEPRSTHGHCIGGTTYVVQGLAQPLAIVGDALFASSMGGGGVSYEDALRTNRAEIFTLSDHTVVCPGHGPLTTVGEEKAHNPFYPEFKA